METHGSTVGWIDSSPKLFRESVLLNLTLVVLGKPLRVVAGSVGIDFYIPHQRANILLGVVWGKDQRTNRIGWPYIEVVGCTTSH